MGRITVALIGTIIALSLIVGSMHYINLTNTLDTLETKIDKQRDTIVELKKENNNIIELNEALTREKLNLVEENGIMQKEINKLVEEMKNLYRVEATAYTAFCDPMTIDGRDYQGCTGITATGVNVKETIRYKGKRIIAVDPDVIPLHSLVEVIIDGEEPFEAYAMDTGGYIKGNKIDILVESKHYANRVFGRQDVTVRVIDWGM